MPIGAFARSATNQSRLLPCRAVIALLLVAVSLGLSNFAAAIGIGVAGVTFRTRLRVGIVFGLFEAGMPIVGLLLGHGLATLLGHTTRWLGGGLLIATGAYAVYQAWRDRGTSEVPDVHIGRLLLTGLALSIDNLAVGFALGAYQVSVVLAAVVIGAVSITMSLIGLELGNRIGTAAGQRGELLGGAILVVVGAVIAAGLV